MIKIIKGRNDRCDKVAREKMCDNDIYVKFLMTEITSKYISMISVIEWIIYGTMLMKIKDVMMHLLYSEDQEKIRVI